jgi:hypothetical protein
MNVLYASITVFAILYFLFLIPKVKSSKVRFLDERWLKNGSFDFAEGLASCVGAKANVPFVGWQ